MDEAIVMGLAERMEAAVVLLEGAVGRMTASAEESVGRIVATVESAREAELERKLAAAEARIAELAASASPLTGEKAAGEWATRTAGRKTVSAGTVAMLSKQGVALEGLEAGGVDAALGSLSVEQRIAVKSELLRAGLLR